MPGRDRSPSSERLTGEERRRCRSAWEAWHRQHAAGLDLAERGKNGRRPGLLLLCEGRRSEGEGGRVWLRGCGGNPRWEWKASRAVITDAQLLPGNRLLLGEGRSAFEGGVHVVERDPTGKLLSEAGVEAGGPIICRRLRNGNTFVSSSHAALEVTPTGKTVTRHREVLQVDRYFPSAEPRLLGNGRIAWIDGRSRVIAAYNPATRRTVGPVPLELSSAARGIEVLPNGHWLLGGFIPDAHLLEADTTGKTVWQCRAPGVWSAARLRNGNTVVGSVELTVHGYRGIYEVDAAGRKVWEDFSVGFVNRIRVCLPLVRFGFDHPPEAPVDIDSVAYRIKGLKDKDPTVRHRTALLLGPLGPKAEAALPALFDALDGLDKDQQRHVEGVMHAVVGIKSLPIVLKAAKDKCPVRRKAAVGLLYKFPDQPRLTVPALLDSFKDGSSLVRREAALRALSFVNEKDVVLALIRALKDKDVPPRPGEMGVAELAAFSLGRPSPYPKLAMRALVEATEAGGERLAGTAIRSLGYLAIGEEAVRATVISLLIDILKDPKQETAKRSEAAFALSNIGPKAKAAVPALREAIRNRAPADPRTGGNLLGNALYALVQMGVEAREAVPDLIAVLRDHTQDPRDRQMAVEALGSMGPAARAALPILAAVSDDDREDIRVRDAARKALPKIRR